MFGHEIGLGEVLVLLIALALPVMVVIGTVQMILRPLHTKLDRALALLEGLTRSQVA